MGRKDEAFNRGIGKSHRAVDNPADGDWLPYPLTWEYKDSDPFFIGEFSCPQKYWS